MFIDIKEKRMLVLMEDDDVHEIYIATGTFAPYSFSLNVFKKGYMES